MTTRAHAIASTRTPRYATLLDRFSLMTVVSVAMAILAIISMVALVAAVFGGSLLAMGRSVLATVISAAVGLYVADKSTH